MQRFPTICRTAFGGVFKPGLPARWIAWVRWVSWGRRSAPADASVIRLGNAAPVFPSCQRAFSSSKRRATA